MSPCTKLPADGVTKRRGAGIVVHSDYPDPVYDSWQGRRRWNVLTTRAQFNNPASKRINQRVERRVNESTKFEFCSDDWIGVAREFIERQAEGADLTGINVTFNEVFTDPPAHLDHHDAGKIGWYLRIADNRHRSLPWRPGGIRRARNRRLSDGPAGGATPVDGSAAR